MVLTMLAGVMSLLGETRSPQTHARPVSNHIDVATLYRQYGDLVFGRCRSLLGNEADAQEATQDVFLKLHRYKDSFRGDAAPTTYLFKITTTTCLNRIRTRKRHPEDPVEEPPEPPQPTDTLLDRLEIRQLVQDLLAGEDERTWQCVVYHYVDGMTHAEVGDLLGISGAAVRKRVATFKKKVQRNPPEWMPTGEKS
jgi:RNA polymerase sigma-70 factor (ECF subfamily)